MTSLPPQLQIDNFPKMGTMKIQTVVLEPQLVSTSFVRFVLERRGILASDSIITFRVDTGNTQAYLPANTGIASVVRNCTLRLGNQIITRTQDWAHYRTAVDAFTDTNVRSRVDAQTRGTSNVYSPAPANDGQLALTNAKLFRSTPEAVAKATNAVEIGEFLSDPLPEHDLKNQPIFSIRLNELFPALGSMQLPLGHMEDNMVIELELNSQLATESGVIALPYDLSTTGTEGVAANISVSDVSMLADYLSYSDATHEEMDDRINGAKGMLFPWHEIVTIMGQYPDVTAPSVPDITEQPVSQELALVGRSVRDVLLVDSKSESRTQKVGCGINGIYAQHSPLVVGETQVKVNDLNVYPRPMTTLSQKIGEVENIFKAPLAVPRGVFCSGSITDNATNNPVTHSVTAMRYGTTKDPPGASLITQQSAEGSCFMEGVPLYTDPLRGIGTTIIDKPIMYTRTLKRTSFDHGGHTSRYFCSVSKAFSLRNGMVSVAV